MWLFSVVGLLSCLLTLVCGNSFDVDYENNCFLKDGKPFRYVSGSIHYFRVPYQLWSDRISKMKMAGLNAIQTYVEWNHHEPEPGVYNFEGNYDLVQFLQTAQSFGMVVILRTGPFIDAERDMGGLPYWLLRMNPNMKIRTFDESYIKYVDRWYSVLLPMIRPLLYKNGGPIIMTQIENEYGSYYACDAQYTSHLRDLFKKYLQDDVLLFTTDGSDTHVLTCGRVDKVFQTMDFGTGTNVSSLYEMFRWHQSSGPLVNSEFYPGWLDHWGEPHAQVSSDAVTKTLFDILSMNASVNIYMFHGGTSFGFSAGANLGNTYQACPTSYDYDAPLSEAGDPTPKYYAIRDTIGKFMPLPPGEIPQPAPKMGFGPIQLKHASSLWNYVSNGKITVNENPLPFEDLGQPFGFVVYATTVPFITTDPILLTIPNLADRGYVFVEKALQGILSREQKIFSLPLKVLKNERIAVLVENQGRVCFGSGINDRKGIFSNVTLGPNVLKNWTMVPIPLDSDSVTSIDNMVANFVMTDVNPTPAFYTGSFKTPTDELLDTFLRVDGWHKGVAFINGFNLGRYWPIVGPQVTLYVPKVLLNKPPTENTITLLELEHAPCTSPNQCVVNFVQMPIVNGTTPVQYERKLPKYYGQKHMRKQTAE